MARTKGSGTVKRGASKPRRLPKETEEESKESTEVVEEIVSEKASTRRGASAAKTAKKSKPAKRETTKRKAKEEIILDEEEDDEDEINEPKGKRSGRNTVELAFSKDDSGAESAEDSKKKETPKPSSSKGKRPGSKSKTIVKKAKREEGDEDEEEDDREYEVERIIDVKKVQGKREFLIKWKGFSIDNSTWEPEENLDHSKDLVQAFLNKVEKGDLSRTRRLSTIQSTKSSSSSGSGVSTGLRKTQQGRVSKSRSRTPSRRSVSKQTEEAPLRPTKREPNGDLALQKFMRESVERKLELLKNKERPRPESTLGTVAEEGGRDRVDARGHPTGRPEASLRNNNVNNRRRFGVFARTALACSAAAASAAALYLTSPDTLNWEHIAPHVQDAIRNIQERYAQLRAQAPF